MKFEELKQNLKSNILSVYYVYGEDEYLKTNAINLICEAVNRCDKLNTFTMQSDEVDAKNLIDTCNTFGFFGKKVVILKDSDSKKNASIVNALKSYIKNPNANTVLVIVELYDNSGLSVFKDLVTNVDCSRLNPELLKKWISNKIKGKCNIMTDALATLIDYTNGYLYKINLELDKLISYCGDVIKKEDVENLVTKDLEYNVFEFTESLGKGNKERALVIFNSMMDDKKSAPMVLNLISAHFRRLFYVAITKLSLEEIANYLAIKTFAVKKLYEQSRQFSPVILKNIVEKCEELDSGIKTGVYNYNSATNYLVNFILANSK